MIQVIGFDLDGTLYPSTPEIQGRIRNTIYQKLAEACYIPVEEARTRFEETYARLSSGSRSVEEICRGLNREEVKGVDLIQDSLQEADILDLLQPNPELASMMVRLSQKYTLDLLTGSRTSFAKEKLSRLGISPETFKLVWGKNEGDKLSGELFRYWIAQRNLPASQLLYVGDNKKQDVDTPKALGIKTCYLGEYPAADYQINNILELEKAVKEI